MFLIFLIAFIFFAFIGMFAVLIINRVLNEMKEDNARKDVTINDIYIDSIRNNKEDK